MKRNTKEHKMARKEFLEAMNQERLKEQAFRIISEGKHALDSLVREIGQLLVESILLIEREELAGPNYNPKDSNLHKWASVAGSVYMGDEKVKIERPRLRDVSKGVEVKSDAYQMLKNPSIFSDELLSKFMAGVSANKYRESLSDAAEALGVSPSSVSGHLIAITAKKFEEFINRDLSGFPPLAIYLDTIHRGKKAFVVALGVSKFGEKKALGFCEGATENAEICKDLLEDLERRGLKISNKIIWVTDGGSGIKKYLRSKFGKKLLHQRCTLHKLHNLRSYLNDNNYRVAKRMYKKALSQNSYRDASKELKKLEKYLRSNNESAANSLKESFEELLLLHKLKVAPALRKSLSTTNPIESMFSIVRDQEKNIKRSRGSKMQQRWLASILLYAEERFNKISGHRKIRDLISKINKYQKGQKDPSDQAPKAA